VLCSLCVETRLVGPIINPAEASTLRSKRMRLRVHSLEGDQAAQSYDERVQNSPPEKAATIPVKRCVVVAPEKWFAVFWEPTHHWFIGRAIEKVGKKWQMCFVHQISADCNLFSIANDVDEINEDDIFMAVDAPAPVSSTRTETLRLTESNYKVILKTFKVLYRQ